MLSVPNTVNMDTRSAISGLLFRGDDKQEHENSSVVFSSNNVESSLVDLNQLRPTSSRVF